MKDYNNLPILLHRLSISYTFYECLGKTFDKYATMMMTKNILPPNYMNPLFNNYYHMAKISKLCDSI